MVETDGIVREFLLESFENLEQADTDLVALESKPGDRALLDRVFRVIHTIKGTCGFLGFTRLESLTHAGESVLSRLRSGDLPYTPEVADLLLELADAVRKLLAAIDASGTEGDLEHGRLIESLSRLKEAQAAPQVEQPRRRGRQPALSSPAAAEKPAAGPVEAVEKPVASPPAAVEKPVAPPPAKPAVETKPAPAAAGSPPEAAAAVQPVGLVESTVRVDVRLLDHLMDLVGELVLTRNELLREGSSGNSGAGASALQRLSLVTSELQEGVMKTRMQPMGKIWGKFPRLVRDLASACGKVVHLEMEGQDTELDRSLIEAIKDPLTHLVRNAIDHGIEKPELRLARGKPAEGRLCLRAYPEGGQVNIQISDDGAGIDAERVRARAVAQGLLNAEQVARLSPQEALNLVFLPGFSTAERVTSVSGRGVGMDVVRTNIEKVNGLVDLESNVGQGTTVRIKIPLTLAIIPAIIVSAGEERFAIPQSSVLELVRLLGDQLTEAIERLHGAPVYRLRGKLLPIVELGHELALSHRRARESATIVVLQADERQFGLLVDGVIDSQEIVVKPLGALLERIPVFVGATIMGDGRVALILDVLGLAQRAHVISEEHERALAEELGRVAQVVGEADRLLLCRSGDDGRVAIPLTRVARLETLSRSSLERVGGHPVVQYRGDILPLIDVTSILPERRQVVRGTADEPEESPTLSVVVYSFGGKQVGLVVAGIVDIVEEVIQVRRPGSREGVSECAVVRGKVTEFLDVESIIARTHPPFLGSTAAERKEG